MNKKKKIIMLFILVIILIVFAPIVLAKYNTLEIIKGNTEIAKPIFEVQGTETTEISAISPIGYYEFSIKNFNETKISETAFWYTIEIVADVDESITFELYKEEQQIELKNLKTEQLFIGVNEKIEQKYKLKVIYDSSIGEKGKDIMEEVQIKVYSEQAK